MRIFLTGATGYIGAAVLDALVRGGHDVTALVRNNEKARSVAKRGGHPAIGDLAEMREWRGAIGTILTYGVPVVGTWPQDYHDKVQVDLAQVAVSASTAADQDALHLLTNDFGNLSQWASGIVAARQARRKSWAGRQRSRWSPAGSSRPRYP